jgi:hypothetical protein
MLIQQFVHYFLHFIFPVVFALIFYKAEWMKTYIILLLTMLVDLDHLLANPIFVPCRCSVGFHLLHSYPAIAVYVLLLFFKPTRIVAIGLVWHMITDSIDCMMQAVHCQ